MCVGTFPPSFDFENYLLHYIIEKRDRGRGAVVDYARYCLRTLEAMLSNGDGTGFVPSVEEILAYKVKTLRTFDIILIDETCSDNNSYSSLGHSSLITLLGTATYSCNNSSSRRQRHHRRPSYHS
jgi:hypothetical protein